MGLLILLQYAISWSTIRSARFGRAVKNSPTLLLRDGTRCAAAMRRQRVTEGELLAAVRKQGHASLEDIDAVVLETDGTLSVITSGWDGERGAMADVPPP